MTKPAIQVILNPVSGGGKTPADHGRILAALEKRLGEPFGLHVTVGPRDATSAAREALKTGCRLIIAVGGDGTFQEVVNGFFEDGRPVRPEAELALIPAGTGNGLAQSFGLPKTLEGRCAVAAGGFATAVDVGRAVFTGADGRPESRYFVNECQAGIGGDVVRKVSSRAKKLGGRLAFGLTTVATALSCPNRTLIVTIDGKVWPARRYVGVVIANGGCMAGGMRLTPEASVTDGLFDILFIHEQTVPERLRHFPKIYSGRHLASPKFSLVRGRAVTLASEGGDGAPFEADGEFWGATPCRIEIVPHAVRLRLSPEAKG
jgi:diacylglycerol kinase (ATP)